MPPRNVRRARSGLGLRCLLLPALACGALPVAAQDLPLKRDYPGSGPYACAPMEVPEAAAEDAKAQARQLASTADQAVILGDLPRALALLDRATELDPGSTELAYRRARVLEDLGQIEAAIREYCRALGTAPDQPEIGDARDRVETLAAAGRGLIPDAAVVAFRVGLSRADQGLLEGAAESFGLAVADAPDWPEARYNRGVMLAQLGRSQAAAEELQAYLDLRPDAQDAIVVSQRIGQLQAAALRLPSPGAALALGIVFPGMGQFYTGRTVGGVVVLSAAGGAIAAALLFKNVVVRCLVTVGTDEACPPAQVVSEEVERPLLLPGIAGGAAVALIGAIEAAIRAGGRRARARAAGSGTASRSPEGGEAAVHEVREGAGDRGVRLLGPSLLVGASPASRRATLDIRIVGVSF